MLKRPMPDVSAIHPGALVDTPVSGEMPRARSALVDRLTDRLLRLCRATELGPKATQAAERVFREVVVPWSRVEAFAEGKSVGWVSEISDDNTPIEFSVTLSPRGSEVRVLFEPQGDAPTLAAHRESALSMHEELAREHGADLSRFRLVTDLFTPPDMQGPFALWSAVVFTNEKPPSFKAYFNPQARGPGAAVGLVEEGLRRLGLARAWRHLARTLARRGPHRDELKYLALDLSASAQARVKVYVRHHDATPEDLEIAATAAPGSSRGEAEDFARAMGGGARRFKERATFTCAAFVGGDDDRPSATTQYVPVCAYAVDDLEVEQRVAHYLTAQQMDSAPYLKLLSAFANRPLNAGVGMQSWIAFRRLGGVPRLTVYLGTETRRVFEPGSVPAGTRDHMSFDSAAAVFECVARYPLEKHPLIARLSREPDPRLYWLVLNNASELLTTTNGVVPEALSRFLEREAHHLSLTAAERSCLHLFKHAATAALGADALSGAAGLLAARRAVSALTDSLLRALFPNEAGAPSVSDGLPDDAEPLVPFNTLMSTDAAAMPAVVRGAFGVHEQLWVALDRMAELVADADGAP